MKSTFIHLYRLPMMPPIIFVTSWKDPSKIDNFFLSRHFHFFNNKWKCGDGKKLSIFGGCFHDVPKMMNHGESVKVNKSGFQCVKSWLNRNDTFFVWIFQSVLVPNYLCTVVGTCTVGKYTGIFTNGSTCIPELPTVGTVGSCWYCW